MAQRGDEQADGDERAAGDDRAHADPLALLQPPGEEHRVARKLAPMKIAEIGSAIVHAQYSRCARRAA